MNTQNQPEIEPTELITDPEEAQQQVAAFLADANFSEEDKKRIIEEKIAEIKARDESAENQTKIEILTAASLSLEPNSLSEELVADEEITEPIAA